RCPASLLCPYTTLFRSSLRHGVPIHAVHLLIVEVVAEVAPRLPEDLALLGVKRHVELEGDRHAARLARLDGEDLYPSTLEIPDLDRKSTRLNSSHVKIS